MSRIIKPSNVRYGRTHKIELGDTNSYVTINRENGKAVDVFITIDRGTEGQGWASLLGTVIGMALQNGVPSSRIIEKLRGQRFEPCGGFGESLSIADGIAKFWEQDEKENGIK